MLGLKLNHVSKRGPRSSAMSYLLCYSLTWSVRLVLAWCVVLHVWMSNWHQQSSSLTRDAKLFINHFEFLELSMVWLMKLWPYEPQALHRKLLWDSLVNIVEWVHRYCDISNLSPQYLIRHLVIKYHNILICHTWYFQCLNRDEHWQGPLQHCCWSICQISKQCEV